MGIEQRPPNSPNFGIVVAAFAVAIPVILIVGWLIVRSEGGHLHFLRHRPSHPYSLVRQVQPSLLRA